MYLERLLVGSASVLAAAMVAIYGLDCMTHIVQAAHFWRDHISAAMQ
jgi:hypothetical protein